MVFKNFLGVKILDFRNFGYSEKIPLIIILIYKAKLKNASPYLSQFTQK